MPSLIVFAGAVFVVMLGLAWLALRCGSQWFANRQNQSAASAKTNLEEMFIFTDADRIMAINILVLILPPLAASPWTGNLINLHLFNPQPEPR